jgi:hypothetical protein
MPAAGQIAGPRAGPAATLLLRRRPPRPASAPGGENFSEPPRVVLVDALPLSRSLVEKPDCVLSPGYRHQPEDPHRAGQQISPQFFIHAVNFTPVAPGSEDVTQDHRGQLR